MKLTKLHARLHPMAIAIPHWLTIILITLGTAFVGAVEQYLQTIPLAQWLSGISDPKQLVPILTGAAIAGMGALLAQALVLFKQWASTLPVPQAPPANAVVPSNPPPPMQT